MESLKNSTEKEVTVYGVVGDMQKSKVEIYNQIWYVRNLKASGASKIRQQAIDVVREVIIRLEKIPDGCAEVFPYEMIEQLREEYLL